MLYLYLQEGADIKTALFQCIRSRPISISTHIGRHKQQWNWESKLGEGGISVWSCLTCSCLPLLHIKSFVFPRAAPWSQHPLFDPCCLWYSLDQAAPPELSLFLYIYTFILLLSVPSDLKF